LKWFNLGKDRSNFGIWLDQKGIDQIDVEKESGLSRGTVSSMSNDENYRPKISTFAKLKKGLKKLGYNIDYDDFWM
jgi:transcriptional regulator with XRE-family HTH domain